MKLPFSRDFLAVQTPTKEVAQWFTESSGACSKYHRPNYHLSPWLLQGPNWELNRVVHLQSVPKASCHRLIALVD